MWLSLVCLNNFAVYVPVDSAAVGHGEPVLPHAASSSRCGGWRESPAQKGRPPVPRQPWRGDLYRAARSSTPQTM